MTVDGKNLAQAARSAAQQMRGALSWIGDAANAGKVGAARTALERDIQRTVVETERLAAAAERPMCVAVFGESQAGKSHLISVLARKGDALRVRFDGMVEAVDYINAINPDRGKEATGLVTRFTIHPASAPPGFPVILRLLDNADIVKILSNSYQFDGRAQKFERTPEVADIVEHLKTYEALQTASAPNGLTQEGVWDIQQYTKTHLGEFALSQRLLESGFFTAAATFAPRLSIADLAGLWSILWGGHAVLTNLYVELINGLAKLGFAETAYCPWDALERDHGSIIDVETLAGVGSPGQPLMPVRSPNGAEVLLPRSLMAALTAELRMQLSETPWPFLERTDLLDFPGYRGRGLEELEPEGDLKGLAVNLKQKREETIKEMVLRGKVEYLFQRYTADLEITAMMLCVKDSNLNVKQLPTVVRDWIASTHGAAPTDRVGKTMLLFFVLTKFDLHLGDKVSDASIGAEVRFEGRLTASLLEPFGRSGESWTVKWTPDEAFNNCFLMRNPNVLAREFFDIDGTREMRVRADKEARFAELRAAFAGLGDVRRHFRDPEHAWDAMMMLNDGGASYLAENLTPVCRPETKAIQVCNRLNVLRDRVRSAIESWYVATDIGTRLKEREEVAGRIIENLYEVHETGEGFGTFLARLTVDEGALADRLQAVQLEAPSKLHAVPNAAGAVTSTSGPTGRPSMPRPSIPRPGLPRPGEQPASVPVAVSTNNATSIEARAARASVAFWIERMYGTAEDLDAGAYSAMPPALLRELIAELEAAARRIDLTSSIAETMRPIIALDRRDQLAAKAAIVAERRINRFVCGLGYDTLPETARPAVPIGEHPAPAFLSLPMVSDERDLAERIGFFRRRIDDVHADYSDRYVADWAFCFYQLAVDNASSESGMTVDVEQNERLGTVLAALSVPL